MKHGFCKTRLYKTWEGIKARCKNKNNPNYFRYGEVGIQLYAEWDDFIAFKDWSLANGSIDTLFIDRINSKGNYEPSNCRWVTRQQQNCNLSLRKENSSGYRGVYKTKNGRYATQIVIDKKKICLGVYDNPIDAARAYDNYAINHRIITKVNFLEVHNASR